MKLSEANTRWYKTRDGRYEYMERPPRASTYVTFTVKKLHKSQWLPSEKMAALLPYGNAYLGGDYAILKGVKPKNNVEYVEFKVYTD